MRRSVSKFQLAVLVVCLSLVTMGSVQAAGGNTVDVINDEFIPPSTMITTGDTVTWTRVEGFHNVRSDDGSWGNDPSGSWTTFTHTFTAPGTYEYYCEIHSDPEGVPGEDMNGVVIVQAPTAVSVGNIAAGESSKNGLAAVGVGLLGLSLLAGQRLFRRA